jgi:ribosomal protein L11 methyltransferase
MREVAVRLPREAVEDVLDRLLPIVPGGVYERSVGDLIELRMRGPEVPEPATVEAAIGRWPHELVEREVADDWRARRLADYEPDVIAGRLVVRPAWAPAADERLIDIVVGGEAAFGAGTHPTTRTCLEWLLELEPRGSFADLGCGTGVLAILAARLGFEPVSAVDLQPESILTTLANADANGVTVTARKGDLSAAPPPRAGTIAANVPPTVHASIAARLDEHQPRRALISGFGADDASAVFAAYGGRGLRESRRTEVQGWLVAILHRD